MAVEFGIDFEGVLGFRRQKLLANPRDEIIQLFPVK